MSKSIEELRAETERLLTIETTAREGLEYVKVMTIGMGMLSQIRAQDSARYALEKEAFKMAAHIRALQALCDQQAERIEVLQAGFDAVVARISELKRERNTAHVSGERAGLWKVADLGKHWIGIRIFNDARSFGLFPRKRVADGLKAAELLDLLDAARSTGESNG